MLEVGTKAPDFELYDQDGKLHKLNDYIGKKVIYGLVFTLLALLKQMIG